MRFLQSVPFRGLLHAASVPESRRTSQWIDCQNGEKARQKAGPEAWPRRNTNKEHSENLEPAERRRDGFTTAHYSGPAWAKRNRSIHYNAPQYAEKYGATKFENNSKIFRN
jgi:hypothetical protein